MFRIIRNAVLVQKRFQFLCKTDRSMMLLLVFNISLHIFNRRAADRKTGKPALPSKPIRQFKSLFHPSRRIRFYFADKLRNGERGLDFTEQMHMISDTIEAYYRTVQISGNPAHVTMKFLTICICDQPVAVFRAEYNMIQMIRIRMSHCLPFQSSIVNNQLSVPKASAGGAIL